MEVIIKKFLFLNIIVFIVMIFSCCASKTSKLVGKWLIENDQYYSIEFFKDGSGINSGVIGEKYFSWDATESGKLSLKTDSEVIVCDYIITGSILKITEDGVSISLKRK